MYTHKQTSLYNYMLTSIRFLDGTITALL